MLSWVSSLLSGVETRNIQSLTVRLGLYKYKLRIFKHNLLTDMKLMSSDISFRWCLQASENLHCSCSMQQWRVTSTEHNEYCNWNKAGGGPESFHWDHNLAESHWHSESYTRIIKQFRHPLLCPFPPLLLSVTVFIFYFFLSFFFLHENCTRVKFHW